MDDTLNPSWLNESFLAPVLQSMEEKKVKVEVLRWSCSPVTPAGNNFMGSLCCVSVNYRAGQNTRTASKKLIIKTTPDIGMSPSGDFFDNLLNISFKKETVMYKEVLPKMNALHSWRGTPKSYVCLKENFLVMEDLREQGYKMTDRVKQLDLAHCKQFFTTLSQFHALSVAVHHNHPDLIESVGKQTFFRELNPERKKEEKMVKFFLTTMMETIKTLPECERYVELVGGCVKNYYDKMVEVCKPSDGFNVLNHGDMWSNNVMFKYNNRGVVLDAKLIDFQMCKYCSFAHDILHFWFTSANEEVREFHKEEMFELYRKSLNQTLEKLKCKERLPKDEFDRQMKACAPFSLQIISNLLTIVMADPDDVLDLSELNLDDENGSFDKDAFFAAAASKNYRSKYYKAVLPKVLQQVEELGAFV